MVPVTVVMGTTRRWSPSVWLCCSFQACCPMAPTREGNRGGAGFCRRGADDTRTGMWWAGRNGRREAGRREQGRGKGRARRERAKEDEGGRVEVKLREDMCLVVMNCELGNGI